MDNETKIKELEDELKNVNEELQRTKDHLKKYTAPARNRAYYDKNSDAVKERTRLYIEKTNYKCTPEQRKEYNKRAYLKRIEKLKNELNDKQND
jgi:hypothetical protein